MKKLKRYLVDEITIGKEDVREIVINESPFLLMMFRGLNVDPDEICKIDWLIKVKFRNKAEASELKDKPVIVEGINYYFYLSTPSDMKNEKAFYIREDICKLVKKYESIVSCKWIDSLEGKSGVNVNKDVTARLSLFLSSSYQTTIAPNYLVLPELEYKTIQSIKTFEDDELVVKENYEHKSVFADGCGIASQKLMKRVQEELEMSYIPRFIGVRSIKLALRGLLVSIDFMKYFNDMYEEDTDTLRKVNRQLEAKDVWGNWIVLNDDVIIVNKTMCKWASKISLEQYEATRSAELEGIMDVLFITKTSKKEPNKLQKTSYQLLCQLALNAEDYRELTTQSYNLLSGVLKGDKVVIYNFLGAITGASEDSETEESELTDRLSYLLQVDFEKFYKLSWMKKTLANMIERNIKELSSGKFFVEGHFKTITSEPLQMLNQVINGSIEGTLKINEFWCNNKEETVLACRFPIASFSEVGFMNFVKNDLYKKYCSHWTSELCVFNAKDIRAKILSGADFDTDTIFTTTNKLMIDAIIPPNNGLHFISTNLDAKVENNTSYNWNYRTYANTAYMGNIIGEIAILNACISNVAQDLGAYVDGENITYKEDLLKGRLVQEVSAEELNNWWSWFNTQEKVMNQDRSTVKEIISNQFYELEESIYKTVEISMIAIDSPKTGILPNLEYIKSLKKNYKKPYYFKFLPDKDYKNYEIEFHNNSILEAYARSCEAYNDSYKGILARVEYYKKNTSWRNSDIFKERFKISNTFNVDEDKVNEAYNIIKDSFDEYIQQRKYRDRKHILMVELLLFCFIFN